MCAVIHAACALRLHQRNLEKLFGVQFGRKGKMPEYCNSCERFLVKEEGEGYLQHLNLHWEVQEALLPLTDPEIAALPTMHRPFLWYRDVGLGWCNHIFRDGVMYEYHQLTATWFASGTGVPHFPHHEFL